MAKKLKIVSIASEIAPFSKTGGLADVARSLPKAIKRLGHDIIAIAPLYGRTINKQKYGLKPIFTNVKVYLNSKETITVNYWQGYLMEGLPVYFIENNKYFSQRKSLYGSSHENARFLTFDVAALKLISLLKYEADIVHCHDWQTGLIPFYLKTDFRYSKTLSKAKTIFTIHNLAFQFGRNWWEVPPEKKDFGRSRIPHLANPDIEYVNFMKRAILSADIINTVSEQYRKEIMTKNFGQDLQRILKNREKRLFGIVNGIDYNAYNPQSDPGLFSQYTYKKIHRKKLNKVYAQKKFGLPIDQNIPLVCATSRVAYQKGIELIIKVFEKLSGLKAQFIIMGDGDKGYINQLKKIQNNFPNKLVWLPFFKNRNHETLLYAASDFFLLPSHHEPCGLNQMIAMRYGAVPIVRKVGGLNDTVKNYAPDKQTGTGFVFENFNEDSLYDALERALAAKKNPQDFRNLMVRVMKESNSWEIPAKKYIALFEKAGRIKNGK